MRFRDFKLRLPLALHAFALSVFLGVAPLAHSDSSCPEGYSRIRVPASPAQAQNEEEYLRAARSEIERRSRAEFSRLTEATKAGTPETFDLVIVGGGPHSAFTFSTASQVNPGARMLLLEGTKELGVFDRLSDGFFRNSKKTGNTFYGSSLTFSDTGPAAHAFPSSRKVGNDTVLAHYAAESPLVLGNHVSSIRRKGAGDTWPAKYRIETDQGVVVYANAVDLSTGMGVPSLRVQDEATRELFVRETERARASLDQNEVYQPLVETVDDFLQRASVVDARGGNFLESLRDKKVVVVGGGDGGKIAVEAICGNAPCSLAQGAALLPNQNGTQILWMNQKNADFPSFRADTANSRYWDPIEKFYRAAGQNQTVEQKLVSVREATAEEAGRGRLAVYATGSSEPIYADHVIFATGYDNQVLKPLQELDGISTKRMQANLDDTFEGALPGPVPIALRVQAGGTAEDIYISGQATDFKPGDGVTKREWKAAWEKQGGGFLEMLGRRSEALGRLLATKAPRRNARLMHLEQGPEKLSLSLGSPLPALASNRAVAEAELRVELQRFLRNVRLPQASRLTVILEKGNTEKVSLWGLDAASIAKVQKALSANEGLRRAIQDFVRVADSNHNLVLPSKKDGRAVLHGITLQPNP